MRSPLIHLCLKVGAQMLLVVAALFSGKWSLIDLLGTNQSGSDLVTVELFHWIRLDGSRDEVEFQARLVTSVVAIVFLALAELFDTYLPALSVNKFRRTYLDAKLTEGWDASADGIRISVMFARRRWYFPFLRVFEWVWSKGFAAHHRDLNLRLSACQGVAGEALRLRVPRFKQFSTNLEEMTFRDRFLRGNDQRFWSWQLSRTREVKAVLSIPMLLELRRRSGATFWKCVGVITVDATSEEAAALLDSNQSPLGQFFADEGKILAALR